MVTEPPKSDAGWRVIALDKTTIAALLEHRLRQQAEWAAAGTRWTQTGYVFTTKTGKPFGPDRMTRLFAKLVAASGLPPVTLHGLRHGAATLALAAGVDLKVVADQLGHCSIVLTADTYVSIAVELAHSAAEAVARLVLLAGRRSPGGGKTRKRSVPPGAVVTAA
jgi:integrase